MTAMSRLLGISLGVLGALFGGVNGSVPASAQTTGPATRGQVVPQVSPALLRVAEGAAPAVVSVRVTAQAPRSRDRSQGTIPEILRQLFPREFGDRPTDQERRPARPSSGSGFIVDPAGHIVTNHHIVEGATSIEVSLADGRVLPAKLAGSDPDTDLALLKVDATGLPAIPLGNSGGLKVGELVLALGKPLGLNHTVTVGSISGTGPGVGADRYTGILQTDLGVGVDASGGPLLNTRGEAVGVATAIATRTNAAQSSGLAIPIDRAKPILQQLQSAGRASGWLGVVVQPVTRALARTMGLKTADGVLVSSVEPGSPAATAGLRSGDVILRLDGKAVDTSEEFAARLAETEIGKAVDVSVIRDNNPRSLRVVVGKLAESRQRRGPSPSRLAERLGLELQELTPDLARRYGIHGEKGVVVTDVRPNSPAAQAGVAAGDVIREVNRFAVEGMVDVERGLERRMGTANEVLLRVERDGGERYVVVSSG